MRWNYFFIIAGALAAILLIFFFKFLLVVGIIGAMAYFLFKGIQYDNLKNKRNDHKE